jgi:ribonuclease P/MRP protein subunit RPP25
MGRAINKAVTIAEILKRKLPLHQINCLTSSEIVDVFEPLEEGLDIVESKRYVSCMTITLSTTDASIDKNSIGYQVCDCHRSLNLTLNYVSMLHSSSLKDVSPT